MFVLKIADIACTKVSQCIVNTIFSKNFLTTVSRITTKKITVRLRTSHFPIKSKNFFRAEHVYNTVEAVEASV